MNCLEIAGITDQTLLDGYDPRERRAILEHKYYLGIELGFDPGMVAALESWNLRYAGRWRSLCMQADCQAQAEEIQRHHGLMREQLGPAVTLEQAARDWIVKYADRWRSDREG